MDPIFIKSIIIIGLIAVLVSLGTALFFLVSGKGSSVNLAKALTARIALSLTIFILIMIAFALGWIKPHSI
jgi:hypothetical protein